MKVLPEPVVFEWDKGNIEKNWLKHGVSYKEIEEVFLNKPLLLSEDIKHSKNEERYQALGKTNNERLIFLSLTTRNNKVRVISARDMSKKEEKIYENI